MDIKLSTEQKVPVRLLNSSTGAGVTGVGSGAVTVYLQPYNGASVVKAVTGAEWTEIDAVNFPGVYDLKLLAGEVSALGQFKYAVSAAGASVYVGVINVVEYLSGDIMALLATISTSASTAATNAANAETAANTAATNAANAETAANTAATNAANAETAALSADTNAAAAASSASNAEVHALASRKLASNRLKIDTVANTSTLYDDDDTTPLYTWDLKDSSGAATSTAIYERIPV